MPFELVLLVLTAVLAVVAVAAALVAVRAARRSPAPAGSTEPEGAGASTAIAPRQPRPAPVAHIVEGRVIVTPTTRQIVDATMNRPLVRVSVLSHGLAHALRPESRDRIMALMRREFRSRRRQRKRAARQAARLENPRTPIDQATITTQAWLGELPPARQKAIDS